MFPIGTVDRPFTPKELKEFAHQPFVHIGNHTSDHAILTNYSYEGIRRQILDAQNDIHRITGIKTIIVSYPNGSYSADVLKVTRELRNSGISIGITVDPKKNYLPIMDQSIDSMQLGRFILMGDREITDQCEVFRAEFSLYNQLKQLAKKIKIAF
jgi:peptidoglycan/xylan/chitin deacetylase (PgdA/CDA1 family)